MSARADLVGALEQAGRLVRRWPAAVLITLAALAALLAHGPIGPYLEERLFKDPIMRVMARVGDRSALHPDVRLVVFDDKSYSRVGRMLDFDDWARIVDRLIPLGFDRFLLLSIHDIEPAGAPRPRLPGLFVGSVFAEVASPRSVGAAEIPADLVLEGGAARGLESHAAFFIPAPRLRPLIGGIGLLNLASGEITPAVEAHDRGIIPHLALRALSDLRWDGAALATARGRLPASADGQYQAEFVPFSAIAKVSLPAHAFFAEGALLTELSAAARDRLTGGRVAILVSNGITGGRSVSTPFGPQPSFAVIAALADGALKGRFVRKPWPWVLQVWVSAILAWVAISCLRRRAPWVVLAAAAAGFLLASTSGFFFLGWYLPVVQSLILTSAGAALLGGRQFYRSRRERAAFARDLELGQEIQRVFLPPKLAGAAGDFAYTFVFRPHGFMSGDWLQAYTNPDPAAPLKAVLAIGDVVGKGASAALMTAVITSTWNRHVASWQLGAGVEAFVAELSETIATTFKGVQNTTLSLALIEDSGVRILSCGAPRWALLPRVGRPSSVMTRPSDPLGMGALKGVELTAVALGPGDTLMAFTDGVIDGLQAVRQFYREAESAQGHASTLEALAESAIRVGQGSSLSDDATVLLIRSVR